MERPKILLLTHGGWGMSLMQGVKMILGDVKFVSEIALTPEMTLDEYYSEVEAYVALMPKGSLILTDMFGGTTTNVAAKLGKQYSLNVLSGLNAPLLIEACSQIEFFGTLDFNIVYRTGRDSVMNVVEEIMKSLKRKEG